MAVTEPHLTLHTRPQSLYFAYGSNLSLRQMAKRCPESRFIGRAQLHNFQWQINQRGYANVIPAPGKLVEGLCYLLTADDEARLDRSEGVPTAYEKMYFDVELFTAGAALVGRMVVEIVDYNLASLAEEGVQGGREREIRKRPNKHSATPRSTQLDHKLQSTHKSQISHGMSPGPKATHGNRRHSTIAATADEGIQSLASATIMKNNSSTGWETKETKSEVAEGKEEGGKEEGDKPEGKDGKMEEVKKGQVMENTVEMKGEAKEMEEESGEMETKGNGHEDEQKRDTNCNNGDSPKSVTVDTAQIRPCAHAQTQESPIIRGERTQVLVYVSRRHIVNSRPRDEYVGRMNTGIADAMTLGVPQQYVDSDLRPYIPYRRHSHK